LLAPLGRTAETLTQLKLSRVPTATGEVPIGGGMGLDTAGSGDARDARAWVKLSQQRPLPVRLLVVGDLLQQLLLLRPPLGLLPGEELRIDAPVQLVRVRGVQPTLGFRVLGMQSADRLVV
jgi:hypothetical protein